MGGFEVKIGLYGIGLAALLSLAACAASSANRLIGTWEGPLAGNKVKYTFTKDRLIVNDEILIGYTATKDTIRRGLEDESDQYSIKGNVLTITQDEGFVISLKKVE